MARREAYAYVRPPSEEEKDFPQVLTIEGTTVTLKESSSKTRSLAVDGVYANEQTRLLDDLSGRLFTELKDRGNVHMHVLVHRAALLFNNPLHKHTQCAQLGGAECAAAELSSARFKEIN